MLLVEGEIFTYEEHTTETQCMKYTRFGNSKPLLSCIWKHCTKTGRTLQKSWDLREREFKKMEGWEGRKENGAKGLKVLLMYVGQIYGG